MAFIRKVKTASGAIAVQIAYKQKGKIVKITHIGSAHTEEELKILLALAQKHLQADQLELFPEAKSSWRMGIKRSFSGLLWNTLQKQYRQIRGTVHRQDRGTHFQTGQLESFGRPGSGSC